MNGTIAIATISSCQTVEFESWRGSCSSTIGIIRQLAAARTSCIFMLPVSRRRSLSACADASEGDAHAFVTAIYKDVAHRLECAWMQPRRQFGYEKPRLASIEGKVEGGMTLGELVLESMRREEGKLPT